MNPIADDSGTATGSIVGGTGYNNVSVTVTHSGNGMRSHRGIVSFDKFPDELGGVDTNIPESTNQIRNDKSGIVTAVFSRSVTDILIAFGSVGRTTLSVPVIVSTPFTPLWADDTIGTTTYQNPVGGSQFTQFTGNEGNNIIRIDGTSTQISFNYTVDETYSTISFGFVDQNDPSINSCNFIFDRHAYGSESGCRRFKRLRHLGYL